MGSKLLIAAGEQAAGLGELPSGVRALIEEAETILVISPTLPGRFEWLASDTDKATGQADRRLQAVLGQLAETGTEVEGRVGSDDPLVAFEDAIHEFRPDHLLIALREADQAGWQERGLLGAIQERFAIPMTVFQVAGG